MAPEGTGRYNDGRCPIERDTLERPIIIMMGPCTLETQPQTTIRTVLDSILLSLNKLSELSVRSYIDITYERHLHGMKHRIIVA